MTDVRMVCKHCGGDSFYADVTITDAWVDSTGVFLDDDGKPHFEADGSPQEAGYDYDIDRYVCNGCRKGSFRLDDLVVAPPEPDGAPIAPCGRCDHGRAMHPEMANGNRKLYARGVMPCMEAGCDCHDYYDREFAEVGQPLAGLAVTAASAREES